MIGPFCRQHLVARLNSVFAARVARLYAKGVNELDDRMEWPNRTLILILCLSAVAVVVPWLIQRTSRAHRYRFLPAVVVTALWLNYEYAIGLASRPGDPLIRIDLLLIVPLVTLDWLSVLASLIWMRGRRRNS